MDTNETKIYITLLIAALSLAVIVGFFTIAVWRHHRRSLRLYREKVAAEIRTLEFERKRIASDLHDDLGPLISAIKLQLSALEPLDARDALLVKKINTHIDEVISKIRTTSNDLVPMILIKQGFISAVRQFTRTINETGKIYIHLKIEGNPEPPSDMAVHLFRMVQEMINNSIRHGKATECSIRFSRDNNMTELEVSDNGVGFDFQKVSRHSAGWGLRNIMSRAELLKARIYIETAPGRGANYQVQLPNTVYENTKTKTEGIAGGRP